MRSRQAKLHIGQVIRHRRFDYRGVVRVHHLVNGDALLVVEVKSTLRVEEVRKLLEDLSRFPAFFPEYRGYRRFGAVAALGIDESADRYAYRQGLFVLTLGREGLVTLRNDSAFRPQDFAADDSVEQS